MLNYGNPQLRIQILDEIKAFNNQNQKKESLKEFEIFKGRIYPYVKEYLEGMLSKESVSEMPIVSSINLCKRVIKQEASIYKEAPIRTFVGVSEEQAKALEELYEYMNINVKMAKANEAYKLQDQTHLQVVLINGELCVRPMMRHHLDAVPSPLDPEQADAYIVSGFDRSMFAPRLNENEDEFNQLIADPEDYKGVTKLALWSDEFNFIMDVQGNIVSGPDVANPIKVKPFVDISNQKDYEYWVRPSMSLTDFTVQFNSAMSDLGQIVRMQGFAQAYLIGEESLMPQNIQIGPNYVLKLPVNPDKPTTTEFGFANPNSDLAGSISYIEMLLSTFLSAQGVDPNIVSGKAQGQSYSSGIERLLAMIDKFEASKADMDLFAYAEKKLFKIIAAYINTYSGTELFKYNIGAIPEGANVEIQYKKPEMMMSEKEKLEVIQLKTDLGIMSQVEAIAFDRGLDLEEAAKVKAEIDKEIAMPSLMPRPQIPDNNGQN
jgi:hypothetical protein